MATIGVGGGGGVDVPVDAALSFARAVRSSVNADSSFREASMKPVVCPSRRASEAIVAASLIALAKAAFRSARA